MVVTIEMTDGRLREYNLSTLCTPDPWGDKRRGEPVVATELDLRLDLMARTALEDPGNEELRLDVIRHVASRGGGSVSLPEYRDPRGRAARVPCAQRLPATSLLLASGGELAGASVIYVSAAGQHKAVAWRQGSGAWLINGTRFEAARRLYYTDGATTSTSAQACRLYSYVTRSQDVSPEEAAELIGFPYDAMREVLEQEAANAGDVAGGADG